MVVALYHGSGEITGSVFVLGRRFFADAFKAQKQRGQPFDHNDSLGYALVAPCH